VETSSLPGRLGERIRATPAGRLGHDALDAIEDRVGGPARRRVIAIFGAVLALSAADMATVGAVAAELKTALGVTNTDVGVLAATTALVGAAFTLPVGVLADRVSRTRLLAISIALWCVAMVAGGAATSFSMLLIARVALGAVSATSGPAIASLSGDYFAASERGRVYGYVLSGEFLGAGLGFIGGGLVAGALSWRFSFWMLALLSALLAWIVHRHLPEPARGGQSRLDEGAEEVRGAEEVADSPAAPERRDGAHAPGDRLTGRLVERRGISPRRELVLTDDPVDMPLWTAVRYVLRIRTNVVLIVASALGYFFFAGVQTFIVVMVRDRFDVGQTTASVLLIVVALGALAGVLSGGRIADRLLARGHVDARISVAAVANLAAVPLVGLGLVIGPLPIALALLVLGAAALSAPNPPLDAARLDIVHPRLWGRAEAVRTVLRMLATAAAPLAFGLLSDALGAGAGGAGGGDAMARTFLIMLAPLLLAGLVLLRGRRTYPRDVATAGASVAATSDRRGARFSRAEPG
jgi:MFS family permease